LRLYRTAALCYRRLLPTSTHVAAGWLHAWVTG